MVRHSQHIIAFDDSLNGLYPRVDFPWSLQHIVPFWSGAEHHDFHHMAFVNNFSTSFRWWDRVLGTDDKYLVYRTRVQAAMKEARAKGLSVQQMKEVEERMVKEAEAEGVRAEAEVERLGEKGKKAKTS